MIIFYEKNLFQGGFVLVNLSFATTHFPTHLFRDA
jgi:hypothetical protein